MTPLKTTFTCCFLFLFTFAFSQTEYESPYKGEKKRCAIIYSIGATGLGLGYYLHNEKVKPLTVEQIELLDPQSINRFDRVATRFSSMQAKKGSDVFFFSSFAFPGIFLANKKTRSHAGTIALMYGETLFLTVGMTSLVKKSVRRKRPLVFNDNFGLEEKQEKNAQYAFFSGHASVVSSNSFFTAKVFSDFFPDSKWKPAVWGAAITIPAITGYLRVRAGKHYPSDVMTGYAVGALVGIAIPHFHKRIKRKINKDVNFSMMPTGGYFSLTF